MPLPRGMPPPVSGLPADVVARIDRWVVAAYPHEACGLLIGTRRPSDSGSDAVDALHARNLNVERPGDRYQLDPADHFAAEEKARAAGLEVVGVWHSHPDHPAEPSETDRSAAWEGWSYLILSVTPEGVAEKRSWRLREEAFIEEVIEP